MALLGLSLSTRRRFSLTKERLVPASVPPRFSSSTAAGGCRSDDELTMPFRSIRFSDRDSAELVTTILSNAWPSLTAASFSSSLSTWTMSSGRPLAGTRKLQRRPSASHTSRTKIVSSDTRSRKRLKRCGAGAGVGSTGTIDTRRRREDESVLRGLSALFLVGERTLSK